MKRIKLFNELVGYSFPDGISIIKRLIIAVDVVIELLIYRTGIRDYFQYEFYLLKKAERRKYVTFSGLKKIMRFFNNFEKRHYFDDKADFNNVFGEYLRREWIDVTESSFDDFKSFVKKHPVFFIKAKSGMFGKNAGKEDLTGFDDLQLKNKYNEYRDNRCIAEQLITQHSELAEFNAQSVNTLRIVTLIDKNGKVHITAGVFRVGRQGKSADNFHHKGIAASVDVQTGTVNSDGIDREFCRYSKHPDSNKNINGFVIPSWDKAVELVKSAALKLPDVRYVGWDVAIDKDGEPVLIEGNFGADPDVTQMPLRKGLRSVYKSFMDEG